MTSRRHIGIVAGAATLLAAMPLMTVFVQLTWLIQCIIAVALIGGAAMLARTMRAPAWAQLAAMLGALLAVLTFLFGGATAVLGLIPTGETFNRFGVLLTEAGSDMRSKGVPVADSDGLLFLTVLGIGSVAVCVDICAVTLRRPALAGLPMLAIYSVPVAVHQGSVAPLPFVAGAAGFLWLLVVDNVDRVRRFGRRFTGDGRDIDVWEPSPLAAAGRRLAIVGLLVAVVLPIAVPGMTTGLLDRFGGGGAGPGSGPGGTGGRSVNLWAMLSGTLNQEDVTDMVRVTTNDPKPYYLRFGVADELATDGFRNRSPSGRSIASGLPDPRKGAPDGVRYVEAHATVETLDYDMNLLPVYSEVTRVQRVDSTWLYDQRMQVIFSFRNTTGDRKYEFDYVRPEYSPDALRTAAALPATNEIQRQMTAVPADVREVRELVARETAGKTNQYDRVRALYEHFSTKNGFSYSLEAKSETGGPAIVEFLNKKVGYCVQYAAALAWLVRAAGIPARVAFGFTTGTSRNGNTMTLTNRNLHAWTEVYFNGFGWVPFDATPSAWIGGSVTSNWAPSVNELSADPSNADGPGEVDPSIAPGEGGTANPRQDREFGNEDENFQPDGAPGPGSPRWPGYLLLGAVLVLVLAVTPAVRRAMLRRRRQPSAAAAARAMDVEADDAPGHPMVVAPDAATAARARHDAHAAWDELIDTMIDFRLPLDPAETPRSTTERLVREASLRDAAESGARLLARAEERARYARNPLLTDELGGSVRSVRRALAERASRRTRWLAVLLPQSVLQRWRLAILTRSAAAVSGVGRWRDAVARVLSPRRLLPSRLSR